MLKLFLSNHNISVFNFKPLSVVYFDQRLGTTLVKILTFTCFLSTLVFDLHSFLRMFEITAFLLGP